MRRRNTSPSEQSLRYFFLGLDFRLLIRFLTYTLVLSQETKITFVREALDTFKSALADFAVKHKHRINDDPEFRMQFHAMCNTVGVDPLSSSKGFWSDLLGIGSYYFRLGVVIIQSCVMLRSINGGIVPLDVLLERVRLNPAFAAVTVEDIKRAMKKLEVLGDGFRLLECDGTIVIVSVPIELSNDHEAILQAAYSQDLDNPDTLVYISNEIMKTSHGWSRERFDFAMQPLLMEGIVWLDHYNGKCTTLSCDWLLKICLILGKDYYYFPNFSQKSK
jgi:ESCRT-II complex subunit VPS22